MKKFAVAIAIMSISVLASCGGGTPEEVAIQFNEALLDGDVEAAQDLSTEETAKLMPLIIGFAFLERLYGLNLQKPWYFLKPW